MNIWLRLRLLSERLEKVIDWGRFGAPNHVEV